MILWTLLYLMLLTLVLGIAAWFLFMWGVKSGQFDDMEGPKYRIFDDDEDGPRGTEIEKSDTGMSKPADSLGEKGDSKEDHH